MNFEMNDVIEMNAVEGFVDGIYRVIMVFPDTNLLMIVRIVDDNKIVRPILIDLKKINDSDVKKSSFDLPCFMVVDEADIPECHKAKRDKQYKIIKNLIDDSNFLLELCLNKKSKSIVEHSITTGASVTKIKRLLNRYWKYSQHKNALLPSYSLSGGRGKERSAGNKKRGAPIKFNTEAFSIAQGKNISDTDKNKIKKGLREFYFKKNAPKLTKAYKKILEKYYVEEIKESKLSDTIPIVPSINQVRYWLKKIFNEDEIIRNRTTQKEYLLNMRGLTGFAAQNSSLPGSCFEIDATKADVHIVSSLNRNHKIGRPTIYSVVDRASRVIVGFHITLDNPSWKAARQALVNTFLDKTSYCKKYDVEIKKEDWPCCHVPQSLMCDRGELIFRNPEEAVVPLMRAEIAPPYRADFKSIVERRFGLLNEGVMHDVPGTTNGRPRKRGEPDPQKESLYTISELGRELIEEIVQHNKRAFDDLSNALLISSGLSPTPLNYWNIHLGKLKHQHFGHFHAAIAP